MPNEKNSTSDLDEENALTQDDIDNMRRQILAEIALSERIAAPGWQGWQEREPDLGAE